MTGSNIAILPSGAAAETEPKTAAPSSKRAGAPRVAWNVLTKKRERFLRQQWSTPENFRAVLNREFFPDPLVALDPCALPRNKVFPHYLCPPTGHDYSKTDPLCLGRDVFRPFERREGLLPTCSVWEWNERRPAIDVTFTPVGGLLPGPAEGRG